MELENFLNRNCSNDNRTKSLIKWAGGKGRVLQFLSPYLLPCLIIFIRKIVL